MKSIIEISGVTKRFKELVAVNNIDLTIYEGEYVALLGPNGAGKTTLIEMIEGIQKPDEGSIQILGMDWRNHSAELHRAIGLSLQETKFYEKITTEETLNLFASFYGLGNERCEEILELINLKEKRKAFTVNLSGGQRQRLAIGVALLNNPKILLLDEPTTGLDPGARREIWKILEKLRNEHGTTMILTTHYMEEAQFLCERILIMHKGKFIAKGTLDELNSAHGEGDLIEMTFSEPFEPDSTLPGVRRIQWIEPNIKVRIYVDNVAAILPTLLRAAQEKGVGIAELSSRKMTLDDLFISMTGRHLND